jgi:hypothetical protein
MPNDLGTCERCPSCRGDLRLSEYPVVDTAVIRACAARFGHVDADGWMTADRDLEARSQT